MELRRKNQDESQRRFRMTASKSCRRNGILMKYILLKLLTECYTEYPKRKEMSSGLDHPSSNLKSMTGMLFL
jgi:hypothetical protein